MIDVLLNIIPAIIVSLFTQLVFHEIGHMLFGVITGWNLLYLQVYNRAVIKVKKTYKVRHLSTRNFQCIMYPKQISGNALLYISGGCLVNLFIASVSLSLMLLFSNHPVIWLYAWCFFVSGMIILFTNAIPNTKRLCNDGACYKLLKTDGQAGKIHNLQLIIAKELFEGKSYRQIEHNYICTVPDYVDNDITAYQAVLEYYYWLDIDNYEMAQKALLKADMDTVISQSVKNIICMERLYTALFLNLKERNFISIEQSEFDGEVCGYIQKHETRGDVHSYRVKAVWTAYEKFRTGEEKTAIEIIEAAVEYIRDMDCIYAGEAVFCMEQMCIIKLHFIKIKGLE